MTDGDAQLRRGRRLQRAGLVVILAMGVYLVVFLGAVLLAVRVGWLANDDDTPVVFLLPVLAGCLVVATVLSVRARRLINNGLAASVEPPAEVPDTLQFGTRRPMLSWVWIVVGLTALALGTLPVFVSVNGLWTLPLVALIAGVVTLVRLVWTGPSVLRLSSARLDNAGIRLPLHGVYLPWSSVESASVAGDQFVDLTLSGPPTPTGDLPPRWTRRALARYQSGATLRLFAERPEMAVWVARRHLARAGMQESGSVADAGRGDRGGGAVPHQLGQPVGDETPDR